MNEYCKIELALKNKLEKENFSALFADYTLTREYLFKDIYPRIGAQLPDFTYHDGSHVINVLDNIYHLLDDSLNEISCETLYFLCLSTLFHDTGLIYGRVDHQKRIGNIYNDAPGKKDNIHKYGNERKIITKIVEAHSGKAIDSTNDTLNYLDKQQLGYREMINVQQIAAILRFADELAEGGQRTSDFFIENNMYKKNSMIFHIYAQAYRSVISPQNGRLAITYNINISILDNNLIVDKDINLENFLNFVYERMTKIDDERKYCRYYCPWLDSMKEISADFNFWCNNEEIEIGLHPIVFSDKIVPGDIGRDLVNSFPDYEYQKIDKVLRKNMVPKSMEENL
jgi:hypothetical protein